MGWDHRGYYSRSRRVDGVVTREYIGPGVLGVRAARLDEQARERRRQIAAESRQRQAELTALDARLVEAYEETLLVGRAALLAAGFHLVKRTWRRRRMAKQL